MRLTATRLKDLADGLQDYSDRIIYIDFTYKPDDMCIELSPKTPVSSLINYLHYCISFGYVVKTTRILDNHIHVEN